MKHAVIVILRISSPVTVVVVVEVIVVVASTVATKGEGHLHYHVFQRADSVAGVEVTL